MAESPVKRPKVAWSDDLSHDSAEDRGNFHFFIFVVTLQSSFSKFSIEHNFN